MQEDTRHTFTLSQIYTHTFLVLSRGGIMTAVTGKEQGRGRQENANAIEKKSDAASRQDNPVTIGPTSWAPCKHPNNQM